LNPKILKIIKITLPLLLGVFLIWYSITSATPEERQKTWEYVSNADKKWILISVFFGIISHLIRAYRWKFLIAPLGYSVCLHNSFMAVMAGYLANLGIPRSGEVLRAGIVSAYDKIPFKKALGTIITERIIDLLMLGIIVLMTVFFQSKNLISFISDDLTSSSFLTIGFLPVLVILGIIALKIIKKSKNQWVVKIRNFGEGILEGIKSIFQIKKKTMFILYTLLIWVLYIAMFYVIKYTVPETSTLAFGSILITFVAGTLAMSLTNGGIGAFPIAIAYALTFFGVNQASGMAFGWILWGSQTAINVIVGALSFLFLPILNREK